MDSLSGIASDLAWGVVSWVAFTFKLLALALVVPFAGLIVFDFFLWTWKAIKRVPRDSNAGGSARSVIGNTTTPPSRVRSTTDSSSLSGTSGMAESRLSQKRAGFAAKIDSI